MIKFFYILAPDPDEVGAVARRVGLPRARAQRRLLRRIVTFFAGVGATKSSGSGSCWYRIPSEHRRCWIADGDGALKGLPAGIVALRSNYLPRCHGCRGGLPEGCRRVGWRTFNDDCHMTMLYPLRRHPHEPTPKVRLRFCCSQLAAMTA